MPDQQTLLTRNKPRVPDSKNKQMVEVAEQLLKNFSVSGYDGVKLQAIREYLSDHYGNKVLGNIQIEQLAGVVCKYLQAKLPEPSDSAWGKSHEQRMQCYYLLLILNSASLGGAGTKINTGAFMLKTQWALQEPQASLNDYLEAVKCIIEHYKHRQNGPVSIACENKMRVLQLRADATGASSKMRQRPH